MPPKEYPAMFFVVIVTVLAFLFVFSPELTGSSVQATVSRLVISGEELPAEAPPSSGAGPLPQESAFDVVPEVVSVSIVQGATATRDVRILNKGTRAIAVMLSADAPYDLFTVSPERVDVPSYASAVVTLSFFASEEVLPGMYFGSVYVSDGRVQRIVRIIITVVEKEPLLSVDVRVPDEKKHVLPGGLAVADVMVTNKGESVDVVLMIKITDIRGFLLLEEQEGATIDGVFSMKKSVRLPVHASPGGYMFIVEVLRGGKKFVGSDTFEIVQQPFVEEPGEIIVVCGNNVCERGELVNCPTDCRGERRNMTWIVLVIVALLLITLFGKSSVTSGFAIVKKTKLFLLSLLVLFYGILGERETAEVVRKRKELVRIANLKDI